MNNAIEILAPAGGTEQLIAAVRSGADAVYLGTGKLNARRNAVNFEGDSLREAVSYCHGRGVRVYVTLNTLVKDGELSSVKKEMESVASCGADAVIIQDLAVAELFKRHCPSMPLHASTQMGIHNLEGALAAKELGFSRVVLARELSLDEIRVICEKSGLEIEVFVHGALCMSFSGSCYLSSILGERSGNRGLCAQPCRLDFKTGDRGYALSLKDMSYVSYIHELINAGVASLKIEGRMKRPEYVSAAVRACVQAVSGAKPDLLNLRAVFSRSGFTDGYLTGKRGLSMFGRRTKEDAEASAAVLGELASAYRNELSRVPVSMRLILLKDKPSELTVTDGQSSVTVTGDVPEKAVNGQNVYEQSRQSFSKTGGTPFILDMFELEADPALMIKPGRLNAMRREALERLLAIRSEIVPKPVIDVIVRKTAYQGGGVPKLRVRLEKKEQLSERLLEADRIYMPEREINDKLIGELSDKLVCELPRLVFPDQEKKLEQRLIDLRSHGLKRVGAEQLGAVRLAARMGFLVSGGFGLNILNSESLLCYESLGLSDAILSFEMNIGDIRRLGGTIQRGILGYGYLPLMLFRACPAREKRGCGGCTGIREITDRTGAAFKCLCSNREYISLLNHIPLYIGDKDLFGIDFVTLYFTIEDRKSCAAVWDRFLQKRAWEGGHTRGLYYRNLK